MNLPKAIQSTLTNRLARSSQVEPTQRDHHPVRDVHSSRIGPAIRSDEPGANDSVYLMRTRKGIVVVY